MVSYDDIRADKTEDQITSIVKLPWKQRFSHRDKHHSLFHTHTHIQNCVDGLNV